MVNTAKIPGDLDDADMTTRLQALRDAVRIGDMTRVPLGEEVNNHVHTRYSFSPYTPAAVAYHARLAGLRVVGSVDHESIGAAEEMKTAAAIVGIGATVGCEVRAGFDHTPFGNRRLNNPDTIGNAYMVLHGVPSGSVNTLSRWLEPINAAREQRNRRQVDALNDIIRAGLGALDYERDVRPLSWADKGGSVTERHILYALARRVYEVVDDIDATGRFLEQRLGLTTLSPVQDRITDAANPHRLYDLLGVFKSELVPRFFIQPDTEECPPVEDVTRVARELGAIPAYAYLGDVGESPTGDKKAQHFEDAFLDELFAALPGLGYQAVTYMPPRNTVSQLQRVQRLASRYGLMEISGVDINSSRQTFHCPEVLQPEFRHLTESTWALVGHEVATTEDAEAGLFGAAAPADRIRYFAELGKRSTPAGQKYAQP